MACKICGSFDLRVFDESATCGNCGVLLCYPYPPVREEKFLAEPNLSPDARTKLQEYSLGWHVGSGARNHHNFTNMALFALTDDDRTRPLRILDYGGGGGQFALVAKSLFPRAEVFIVDMQNERMLDAYRPLNRQIRFEEFEADETRFDVIFMNDVFEHVSDPLGVLKTLKGKLCKGGRIFIDTPCTFWLYPVTKLMSKRVHVKLLRGTVDFDHQQIWTRKSFYTIAERAELKVEKFRRLSEYTQPAAYYMDNMKITSPVLRLAGHVFVALAPYIARNKIMAVLTARCKRTK